MNRSSVQNAQISRYTPAASQKLGPGSSARLIGYSESPSSAVIRHATIRWTKGRSRGSLINRSARRSHARGCSGNVGAPGSCMRVARLLQLPPPRQSVALGGRKLQVKGRASPQLGLEPQLAAVLDRDPVTDREPQPGALIAALGGEEGVEDPRANVV